jgi:hypothetical protein
MLGSEEVRATVPKAGSAFSLQMRCDMETVLIVLLLVFLLGGGGWGYRRWRS